MSACFPDCRQSDFFFYQVLGLTALSLFSVKGAQVILVLLSVMNDY